MGLPLYDVSVRTSQVTSAQVLCALLPGAAALGTGRPLRMKTMTVSNTTGTGFGFGFGVATAAGATPGGGSTPVRRSMTTGAFDPPATAQSCYTTYATQPTAPATYNGRLWVPANAMVVWTWDDGEELLVPPNATPLPFCLWLTGTGQIADVTLSWEE